MNDKTWTRDSIRNSTGHYFILGQAATISISLRDREEYIDAGQALLINAHQLEFELLQE
jgi:hypothetical protein